MLRTESPKDRFGHAELEKTERSAMKCNVSNTQRLLRVASAAVAFGLGVAFESWWGLVGLLPLYTITIAWCPKQLFCAMPSPRWWHQCCKGCC
jgi:Protein of unknown function (DUF2892)